MIRGGHIDVTILGAFEVASNGDLANWDMRVPDKGPLVGGAMDLASGARAVWVIMEHNTRKGAPRLVEACTLPLTGKACVKRIYTDLAVIDVTPAGFLVREVLDGLSREELQKRSAARLAFAADCRPLSAPSLPDSRVGGGPHSPNAKSGRQYSDAVSWDPGVAGTLDRWRRWDGAEAAGGIAVRRPLCGT